jgi:polysaccharide biosynthesis protein PslG
MTSFNSQIQLFLSRVTPHRPLGHQPRRTRNYGFSIVFPIFLFVLIQCIVVGTPAVAQTVSSNFFGMHMHTGILGQEAWPIDPFGTMRLWDTNTGWADINASPGVYNWTTFDAWLATAQKHGNKDVLYTFGKVPDWASSKPLDTTCAYGPGECDPPKDLNADGTGTDQYWKDYVRAIVTHAAGKVTSWELWNEPNIPAMWTGTNQQMVRMAADARTIILEVEPSAVLLTPCPGAGITGNAKWLAAYFSAGGGNYADVIAFHAYVHHRGAYPVAEDVITMINNVKKVMAAYSQTGKPMWNSEGSWGRTSVTGFTNLDLQASFAMRYILLQWSNGMSRSYWYQWNNTRSGLLWSPTPTKSPGTLLKPGIAYGQAYEWLVGATMSSPCSMASDYTWTCTLTRPGGYQALAIWNTSGYKSYIAPGEYKQYRTSYGRVHTLPASHSMHIGIMPRLLEN